MVAVLDDSGLDGAAAADLFQSLDDEGRARLMEGATPVSFGAGQVVVREGDPGEELYVIQHGTVEVHTTREGEKLVLASLGPGACFGEVALLSSQPRTATVVTLEPCGMLRFHRSHIEQILVLYPEVRRHLESVVLGRAMDTIEKITGQPAR